MQVDESKTCSIEEGKMSERNEQEKSSLLPEISVRRQGLEKPEDSIIFRVCSFILFTEFCERLAYYGLSGSLPIFFRKHFGMSNVLATEINSAFSSMVYITPLLGAYVADKYWGRYWTIVAFCGWYLVGLIICVIASHPSSLSTPLFMFGLFGGIAFGSGGIKPNVVVLGADQFDMSIPNQRREKDSFFNWFYWAINIGATFSFGFIANVAVNGLPPLIPKEDGFFYSFLIPLIFFVLAYGVFIIGSPRYKKHPPLGSAISIFIGVVLDAARVSPVGKIILAGGVAVLPAILITIISFFINDPFWHLCIALIGASTVVFSIIVLIVFGQSTAWLDSARQENGGTYSSQDVNDAKQVLRLSPYLSFIIMFWAIYGQQSTNFLIQGCQMDLRVGEVQISSAMLSVLDSSVILLAIPLLDRYLYPWIEKRGIKLTLLRKMGGGFVFGILAMLVAGFLEIIRKQLPNVPDINSNCAASNEFLPMASISVWWQAPQFVLIGLAEILATVASYDLFYSEVPQSMRSVCQALNLLTTTLGCIVTAAINSIFSFWITSNLNDGQLQNIFFIIAGLMSLNLMGFILISRKFTYHSTTEQSTSTKDLLSHKPNKEQLSQVTGYSPAFSRISHLFGKNKNRNPK